MHRQKVFNELEKIEIYEEDSRREEEEEVRCGVGEAGV